MWREGEDSRRVKDLVGAFARFPRLPKMMSRRAILDTIVNGCVEGVFVARLTRPDKSVRTFWRQRPDEAALEDLGIEVVLPEKAELSEVQPELLVPGALNELWVKPELSVSEVRDFFGGGKVVHINRGGYQEPIVVPVAASEVVSRALAAAIREGKLWLTAGPASLLGEEVPAGLLSDGAIVQAPPRPVSPTELLPDILPGAWADGTTTAISLSAALAQRVGKTLPWVTVREAIDGALRTRLLERTVDSGPWPCDLQAAAAVKLKPASVVSPVVAETPRTPTRPGTRVAEAELKANQIQDLAEVMGDLLKAKGSYELTFRLRVEVSGKGVPNELAVSAINKVLKSISESLQLT